jgi:hypothetical protein
MGVPREQDRDVPDLAYYRPAEMRDNVVIRSAHFVIEVVKEGEYLDQAGFH